MFDDPERYEHDGFYLFARLMKKILTKVITGYCPVI